MKLITRFSILGFFIGSVIVLAAVFTSDRSTASVGLLWIPVYGSAVGLLFRLVEWAFYEGKRSPFKWAALLLVVAWGAKSGYGWIKERQIRLQLMDRNLQTELIEEIRKDAFAQSSEIQALVALHPHTSRETLIEFSKSTSDFLVGRVGENPNLPVEYILEIARGVKSYQRSYGIAQNANTPVEALEELANVKETEFKSKTEWSLYQTYVLAPVIKQNRISKKTFDQVAMIEPTEVFLAYALLDSTEVNCQIATRLLQHENPLVASRSEGVFHQLKCSNP